MHLVYNRIPPLDRQVNRAHHISPPYPLVPFVALSTPLPLSPKTLTLNLPPSLLAHQGFTSPKSCPPTARGDTSRPSQCSSRPPTTPTCASCGPSERTSSPRRRWCWCWRTRCRLLELAVALDPLTTHPLYLLKTQALIDYSA